MPKRPQNFRLSEACLLKLAKLVEARGGTKTSVIEALVMEAPLSGLPAIDAPQAYRGDTLALGEKARTRRDRAQETAGGVRRVQPVPKPDWKRE